jgi:DNA polymerase-1
VEANSLDWWADDFRVFLVQWDDGAEDVGCWREGQNTSAIDSVLSRHETLVGANFGYDCHAIREFFGLDLTETHRCYDVQTLARIVVPGRYTYTLESLGRDLLGADAVAEQDALKVAARKHKLSWTLKDKDYYGLWKLEPDLMVRYGMEDVRLTHRLFEMLWKRATAVEADVFLFESREVSPILRAAERVGPLVDKTWLAQLKQQLIDRRAGLRDQLLGHGFSAAALGDEEGGAKSSDALLRDLLAIGVPLYRKTAKSGEVNPKTGKRAPDKLTTAKDALKEFERRFPAVADLIAWRSCNQILSTFVPAMERANPRVHTSFRQAEARTSRMSSAQPNMQNLPRPDEDADPEVNEMALGIRRVIVPEPGNALLVLDYASIEVMVMAHYIADEGLTAELEAGKDLYSLNASRVYGEPYDVVHKGGAKSHLRQRSKTTVLQCMYGSGAHLLGTRLGVTTVEAAKIKDDALRAIPGYNGFNDRVQKIAAARGRRTGLCYVETILGRRLAVPRDKLYVALNTVVQGTSAEIMKLGLVAAAPVMAEYGFKPLLVVHDELVAEGPACAAEECLLKSKVAMESVFPLRPALKVSGDWSTVSYANAK